MSHLFAVLGLALSIITTSAIAFPAPRQDGDDAALRSYYTANGLLDRGMNDLAAEEYRAFLAVHASHEKATLARYGLAVSLYRTSDFEAALAELEQLDAAREFEFDAEVQLIQGQCQLALGQSEEAAATLRAMLERHADHELGDDATSLLCEARYRAGDNGGAIIACDALVERWPNSALRERTSLFGGLAAMAQEDYGSATERFQDMTDRYPGGEHVEQGTLMLAQCAQRASRLEQAAQAFERIIESGDGPFTADAMYGLGMVLYEDDRPDEAAAVLADLVAAHGDTALGDAGRLLLGRIRFDEDEHAEALALFVDIEHDETLLAEAAYWMAKCELAGNDPAAAAERLSDAVETHADSELRPRMLYDLAVARVRNEEQAEATEALRVLLAEHADHELAPDAMQLLAFTLHQLESYDESARVCAAFLGEHADHDGAPAISFLSAENEYLQERYDESIVAYERFVEQFGEDERVDRATFRLGMAHYALDHFDAAIPYLAAVAKGDRTPARFRSALLALGDAHFQEARYAETEAPLSAYATLGNDVTNADDALLKLGLARQRQEKWAEALVAYDKLLEEHADSTHRVHALFETGQVRTAMDDDSEAIKAFRAVARDDESGRYAPYALNHLGTIALRREAYQQAAEFFTAAAEVAPDQAFALRARREAALSLMAERAYDDAVGAWDAVIAADGNDVVVREARAQRAVALARAGEHAAALEALESLGDGDAWPEGLGASLWYERAWCLRELDRDDEAQEAYAGLLAAYADAPLADYARLELAELRMDAEDYEDATELLAAFGDRADEPGALPDDVREQVLYRQGVSSLRTGAFDHAAERLEILIRDFESSELAASAALLCGEALHGDGRHQRAIEHLQRVVDSYPEDPTVPAARLRLGECHLALQQWEDAADAFSGYLADHDGEPLWFQARFGIGWARENLGEYDEAVTAYQVVVDRHSGPTAARAQFQIGECLFAQGLHDEAVRALLRVDILYDYPEWSAAALYEAGRCFEAMNDPVQARRQFVQVREDHPDSRWAQLAAERIDSLSDTGLPGR